MWAFEPNRENYRCARITLELNAIGNVELLNAGLGAREAVLSMRTRDSDGSALGGASYILAGSETGEPGCQQVRIVTVDDVVPQDREVSIIQLDVEGHEQEALSGALATIRRCGPAIVLEVWPGSNLTEGEWFAQNILALGYRKSAELHRNSVFVCERGPGPGQ